MKTRRCWTVLLAGVVGCSVAPPEEVETQRPARAEPVVETRRKPTFTTAVPEAAAARAPARFAQMPTAVRVGDDVRITFAMAEPADVAVSIEDAQGRVVRHLAAGVLGKNAPAPLAQGQLEQTLVWDGKDDLGGPTQGGPFKVRVSAGLRANYAGTAFAEQSGPNNIDNVIGLAVGPGGRVYALSRRWQRAWWTATSVHVFRRDGAYEKTIKPFPSSLSPDRLKPILAMATPDGRPMPVIYRVLAMLFYPYEDIGQQMAVTPDGNLHYVVVPAEYNKMPVKRLATIDADGGIPYDDYAGPPVFKLADAGHVHVAPAADGKAVYLTGVGQLRTTGAGVVNPGAVYRIPLPERREAIPFFGDPKASGAGESHLNDPRGLATDGKGRLFIADRGNDRVVVVDEKTRAFKGDLLVKAPVWVGVHRVTEAVYVVSEGVLVKFAGWSNPKEVARLALPRGTGREDQRAGWVFALDAEADPAVIWVGRGGGADCLLRTEDRGGQFSPLERAGYFPSRMYWNVTAGQSRREVACKVGNSTLRILDEATGTWRDLNLPGSAGQTYRLGPNGQIYGMDHAVGLLRWDRTGRSLPFPTTAANPNLRGRLPNRPSGTTSWERDFSVDCAGNIYVKQRGKEYHGRMRVDEYDPDGNFKRTVIWVVSDGALGPRLDLAGNLYLAESIKPLDTPYPDCFEGRLRGAYMMHQYTWMYGSVIKFGPTGGAVWFPILTDVDRYGFDGQAKLDPALGKEEVSSVHSGRMVREPALLQGALWWRFGCSFLLDMHRSHNERCHCTGTDFDVDDFGRIFYPDQGRFRVTVLDTNGNEIVNLGGYGNQDSCGPMSYVLDPSGGHLRPRRADDPPGLASPAAQPDLAFGWIVGLAVSERTLYVADGLNRRVLMAALTYDCDARVDAP